MSDKDRQKQGLSSLEALAQQTVKNILKDVHTSMPGVIDTFDPETQTCTVQPSIKRIFIDGEALPLPKLINVPVSFPSAGGFSITLPVKKGDECLIIFSERSLDNWLKFGGIKKPNDRRFHDLSDGLVIMGLKSNPNKIVNYDPDNLSIRKDDESVSLTVKATSIDIKGETNIEGNLNVDGNIDSTGDIHASGTITGDVDVVGGGVSLKNHTHPYTWTDPAGSGNTGTPT